MVFSILYILLICPFIIWGILYLLFNKIKYTKKKAAHLAIDMTTPFFIYSIQIIILSFFGYDIGFLAYIVSIAIIIAILVLEKRKSPDFEIYNALRKAWRLLFIIFLLLYCATIIAYLVILGIDFFK